MIRFVTLLCALCFSIAAFAAPKAPADKAHVAIGASHSGGAGLGSDLAVQSQDAVKPEHVQALELAQARLELAQHAVADAKRARDSVQAEFAKLYKIGPRDQLAQLDDGSYAIKRAPTEEPPKAPAKVAVQK